MKLQGPSKQNYDLARRLIFSEIAEGNPHSGSKFATLQVCEKFRLPLSALAGKNGFQSLLARALTVAKSKSSALNSLRVEEDGTLHGWEDVAEQEATDMGVTLVADLIALQVTLIGEYLTFKILNQAWPDMATIIEDLGRNESG